MRFIIIIFTFTLLLCQVVFALKPTMTFSNACVKGDSIVIAAVGDVLLHEPLQLKGKHDGFDSLWREAIPFFKSADIVYANLEGPIAHGVDINGRIVSEKKSLSREVYTGFPMFNYPPSLAYALKDSGIDIVSTANNHALDRYSIGIDKTIAMLNKAGVAYVGTRPRGSKQSLMNITEKRGFKIAWIACTEMTNGFHDKYKQVLYCYKKKDKQWIINTIRELKSQVDAIIVTPHWGEEYHVHPNDDQKYFAHQVLDAGALAVIGSHPHVLEPLQKYHTKDGRETIIMYSLGNFVSYQSKVNTRNTVILLLGLTRTQLGTTINGIRFVPMYMQNRGGWQNLRLAPVQNLHSSSNQIIPRVMPVGNAIYSPTHVINNGCDKFLNSQ